MPRIELYPFRFRDPVTGKWRHARHKAERHEIAAHNEHWEITGPPDVREVNPNPRYFSPWTNPQAVIANVGRVLGIVRAARPHRVVVVGVAS